MPFELICALRLLLAVFLGFMIGFERKLRSKEAGIRTHTIVCLAACLFTLISIYAFVGDDTSRVAAQIVSGIGFIGAGMIFHYKEAVRGLTTAAGIWATAAIGMAVGAGWYIVSIIATVIMVIIQFVLHLNVKLFKMKSSFKINVSYVENNGELGDKLKEIFKVKKFNKITVKKENSNLVYSVTVYVDDEISTAKINDILNNNPEVLSISYMDDEM